MRHKEENKEAKLKATKRKAAMAWARSKTGHARLEQMIRIKRRLDIIRRDW